MTIVIFYLRNIQLTDRPIPENISLVSSEMDKNFQPKVGIFLAKHPKKYITPIFKKYTKEGKVRWKSKRVIINETMVLKLYQVT